MEHSNVDSGSSDMAATAKFSLALNLTKNGYKVFPCNGKAPITAHGFKNASCDPQTIIDWWKQYPPATIGIATGIINRISVVDVDNKPEKGKNGLAEWQKLQEKYGIAPDTFTVRSPSGGIHLYFKHKDGFKNSTDKLANGIDTRGDGGYIIASGSSINGVCYTVEKNLPLAELPDWVFEAIAKQPEKKTKTEKITARLPDENRENQANRREAPEADVVSALNSIDSDCDYQTWIEFGQALHTWDSVRGFVLWDEWSRRCKMYDSSTQTHWKSFKADGGITIGTLFHHAKAAGWKPNIAAFSFGDPITAAKAGSPWPMTDAGNAERLAYYMRGKLVFDERMQRWRHFNGKKWEIDTGKHIHQAAIKVVRKIRHDEAMQCQNEEMGKKLWSHSIMSESRNKLEAIITLAQHVPGMSRAEFDVDKYLFNCQNGTIELKTGTLREHRANDFITRISPVAYDPNADFSTWTKFLYETLHGDREMIRFIQKSDGYCLSGDTSEEILFLVHGPEATGKSTYMEGVKSALGDYSKTCDFGTFLKQKDSGRPRNDLAGLSGARLVSSCEVEEGKTLAENIIKNVTGGDTISARFLFKEFFEYEPQFKLWLICNHAPKVDAQDGAMWRRILRIPFSFIIPKEKRDKKLKTMLKDPAIGGVQILKWAVEGFLLWQAEGLHIPEAVVQATEEYRQSCDYLSYFFSEVCDVSDPLAWMSTAQLFDAYKKYCEDNEIKHTMSQISFSKKLNDRGLKQQKQGGIRGWQGICPASKVPVLDRLDTSSTKSPIEPPFTGLCRTSVQSVQPVQSAVSNVPIAPTGFQPVQLRPASIAAAPQIDRSQPPVSKSYKPTATRPGYKQVTPMPPGNPTGPVPMVNKQVAPMPPEIRQTTLSSPPVAATSHLVAPQPPGQWQAGAAQTAPQPGAPPQPQRQTGYVQQQAVPRQAPQPGYGPVAPLPENDKV